MIIKIPTHGSSLQCLSGTRRHEVFPARGAGVGHPFEDFNMKRSQGGGLALDVPIDSLIDVAERLTGLSYGRGLASRMASTLDFSSPASAAFARSLSSAMVEIAHLNSHGLGDLAMAGHEEIILGFAVASLFPEVVAKLGQIQPDCGPTGHSHGAGLYSCACRGGDRTFPAGPPARRQHEGLAGKFSEIFRLLSARLSMDCRLDRARRSLLSGDPGSLVTGVALASGFGDVSHFSAKYRVKFGEAPSETLRLARRQFS